MKLEFKSDALRPIGRQEISQARELASESPRRRGLVRYHDHSESIQRMINAVRASSYVRPHKHEAPDKTEVFIALQGSAIVCTFDERGVLRESLRFGEAQATRGVEIPARIWHSLIALEEETVLYEIIEGPFDDRTHKRYAPWAPEENSAESEAYFRALREKLGI